MGPVLGPFKNGSRSGTTVKDPLGNEAGSGPIGLITNYPNDCMVINVFGLVPNLFDQKGNRPLFHQT